MYRRVRGLSVEIVEPLSPEDCCVQSMPNASPAKWHLAHSTWFFETFLLKPFLPGYETYDDQFCFLFNSYYNAIGDRQARPNRGLLTRPSLADVRAYRDEIDRRMEELLDTDSAEVRELIMIGLHHEMQHQELMVTDMKHLLWRNPLKPAMGGEKCEPGPVQDLTWVGFEGGVCELGIDSKVGEFAYDNESPKHRVFLEAYEVASRVVTNGEYQSFVEDGGYRRSELWLDAGWSLACAEGWTSPLYWSNRDGEWHEYATWGEGLLDPNLPAAHLSYFEADAYARWARASVITESQWEHAALHRLGQGPGGTTLSLTTLQTGVHPFIPDAEAGGLVGMLGGAWEWTSNHYSPYPGYKPPAGALGEYNGKFMCGSFVLRGGSCASPEGHVRPTYRNFWDPANRHQFNSIRLSKLI